jgi:hypothetical protein
MQQYFKVRATLVQLMMKEKPTKCIFKVNNKLKISVLLLSVSALKERHLQGVQKILMELCVCYVIVNM